VELRSSSYRKRGAGAGGEAVNVIGFCCLHYGTDFLAYSIRSVIDHVDQFHCIYSPVGSHGHHTDRKCPDTRDELYAIARSAAGSKLVWTEGRFPHEGAHRSHIHTVAPDADVILVVDADEIWHKDTVEAVVYQGGCWMGTFEQRQNGGVARVRLPMIHMWRSFYRAIVHDPAFPVRVLFPKVIYDSEWTANVKSLIHFGYAQRPEIVEYKQHTHGHKNEWDWSWFENVFMTNRQHDTHPVGSQYWQPEAVNPWDYLPDFMRQHPYANMEVIE
jgi:hypothetical protein